MNKHFELNGSRGWIFSFMLVIILQCIAVGFWAGGVSKDIQHIKNDIVEVKASVKEIFQRQS